MRFVAIISHGPNWIVGKATANPLPERSMDSGFDLFCNDNRIIDPSC